MPECRSIALHNGSCTNLREGMDKAADIIDSGQAHKEAESLGGGAKLESGSATGKI